MAKKTRTELSTLAINTNLPDNTTELITPTTERAQLTDERESVVNYKDDLGGVPNAGKFLTVAADGESLTMVDEPSGVPDWVTFQTAAINLMKLLSGSSSGELQFLYDDAGVDTLGAKISWSSSGNLVIVNDFYQTAINLSNQINFSQAGGVKLIIETTGDLTHNADIMALNAQQAFSNSPLYTFKFQGKVTGSSGGVYTFEEFANIKGGKENATENDKAGYLSFTTGISDGTLTERLRILSGGAATFTPSGGSVVIGSSGHITSTQALDAATAGGRFIGSSNRGVLGDIRIEQTTTGADGGYIRFMTSPSGSTSPTEKMRISSGGDVTITQPTNGSDAVLNLTAKSAGGNTRTTSLTYDADTEKLIINNAGTEILRMGSSTGVIESNYGIKFGTGDTLDAYEEGTFVPTASISGASGAITIDAVDNELSYTRIGERVFISGFVKIATNTANGGRFNLLGFPFTSGSDDGRTILQVQIEGGTGTQTSGFYAVIFASSTTIQVKTYTGVDTSNNSALTLQANTVVAVSGSYKVA